ncbi:DUF5011/hyalin repeat domain-containing protein [Taibaiella helva]|uniref:hypothetical protein n=1 Tax=Taibaiella helva TaxID=2301235 RepID=UPI00130069A8|nr:hypothetical protein [Taibaiella helva]
MKRIILFSIALAALLTGCKKRDSYDVSTVETVSYPSFTFTGSRFVSIPTGGTVPPISVTAYDSFYNESCTVTVGESTVDNTTPGLYTQEFVAKNSRGFKASTIAYVAVTDIDASQDLSGVYKCVGRNGLAHVTELANGLYETDNVGGNPTGPVAVYFVQVDDTTLIFPSQPTTAGDMSFDNVAFDPTPPATYQYSVINPTYGAAPRVFVKQE